jgi:hypothetical protein
MAKADNAGDLPDKDTLDRQKIQAEIDELTRPMWRKSQFYLGLSPVALAIVGLLFTEFSGFFDHRAAIIQAHVDSLRMEEVVLDEQLVELRYDSMTYNQSLSNLDAEYEIALTAQRDSLAQMAKSLEDSIVSTNQEYIDALRIRLVNAHSGSSENFEAKLETLIVESQQSGALINKLRKEKSELGNKYTKMLKKLGKAHDSELLHRARGDILFFFVRNEMDKASYGEISAEFSKYDLSIIKAMVKKFPHDFQAIEIQGSDSKFGILARLF